MDATFKETAFTPKHGKIRPVDIISVDRRKIYEKTVTNLGEAAARNGCYLQQIAVRDEGDGRFRLIYGHQRLEAWKAAAASRRQSRPTSTRRTRPTR